MDAGNGTLILVLGSPSTLPFFTLNYQRHHVVAVYVQMIAAVFQVADHRKRGPKRTTDQQLGWDQFFGTQ